MTRDSIPRDDLYGELEVSRQASVAAIEAAYRRLVKQHHPDVARSDDFERIKRLNLAREWLTDLDRRRRYDVSRGMSPTTVNAHGGQPSGPAGSTSTEPVRSFGVNANEVRIFLASLRGLDSERARRVFDGRAVAHAKGYAGARRLAAQIGQANRKTEWQLAREAASVIARGKLGDTTLTEQVVDVLADTAGAIAIRDLLSKSDYRTLLIPWTWKSARVVPTKASGAVAAATARTIAGSAAAATTTGAAAATPPAVTREDQPEPAAASSRDEQPSHRVSISDLGASRWQAAPEPELLGASSRPARAVPALSASARLASVRPVPARPGPERPANPAATLRAAVPRGIAVPSWLPAAMAVVVFVVVAATLLGIGRPPPEQRVAGITDAPTNGSTGATGVIVAPGSSLAAASGAPGASDPAGETSGPDATEPPGPGGATQRPESTPPRSTPRPTREPPPATPPPKTPPPATPTPEPECTVPNLIGTQALKADERWAEAGFTGGVSYWPVPPPNYMIGWQSLLANTVAPCASEILVQRDPP